MTTTLPDFALALPEIVLLAGACALMIFDLFARSERRVGSVRFAGLVLLASAAATLFVLFVLLGTGGAPAYTFNGLFVSDVMSLVLKLGATLAVALALAYSRRYLYDRGLLKGEFLTLLLFALLGMMVMMSATASSACISASSCCRCACTRWWRSTAIRRSRPRRR